MFSILSTEQRPLCNNSGYLKPTEKCVRWECPDSIGRHRIMGTQQIASLVMTVLQERNERTLDLHIGVTSRVVNMFELAMI